MPELKSYYKREGVGDLVPMKTRASFARALKMEDEAGKCTPEAMEQVDRGIQFSAR